MRVCLLNDSFPPQIDGVANTVKNYASILQKEYGSVVVAVPAYPGVVDSYPYSVVRYPSLDVSKKMLGYRAGIPLDVRTHYRLNAANLDIIHSHCPYASTVLARALREEIKAPLVFTYHTKFDIDIENVLHHHLMRKTALKIMVDNISACDEVWAVSHGAAENLAGLGYQGDIRIMHNGVDFPRGDTRGERTAALAQTHGLPEGVPIFLFVGRMMWYKGNRITLHALKRLLEEGRDFRMIFVGDGADRPAIQAYSETLGLADRCLFPGAIRDRELLRDYFSLSDLFLFPSTYDTNGIVVREAAACALPSLLIEGSCAAEDIEDGVTGFLCAENDASMADKLRRVMDRPEFMRRVGENAMERIYLSWEDAVASACRRYEEILEEKAAGRLAYHKRPTQNFFVMAAEMQQLYNRVFRMEEQLRRHADRVRETVQVGNQARKANVQYRTEVLRGRIRLNRDRLTRTARRTWTQIESLPKRVWEDLDRYL